MTGTGNRVQSTPGCLSVAALVDGGQMVLHLALVKGGGVARKNRYTGVLRPVDVGRGSPEVSVLLIYDIEDDKLRTRTGNICLDYGLERIQFSAFFGKLNRNRRQELTLRLQREIGSESGRLRMIPICEQDVKEMWVLDQYRLDADELAGRVPRLRVLGQED